MAGALAGGIWVGLTTWAVTYGVATVVRIMVGLGIGFATYSGADFILTEAETYIFSNFQGLPTKAYAIAVLFGFSEGLHIIFAAFTASIGIKAAMGGYSRWTNRAASFRA